MKFMKIMKDGGPLSRVTGFFLVEIKCLFSIVILRFDDGARDAYHTHAFNAVSWVMKGRLIEQVRTPNPHDEYVVIYDPSWLPIWTPRRRFHRVVSVGTTWAISFRGPWTDKWSEYLPVEDRTITLTHGRKII